MSEDNGRVLARRSTIYQARIVRLIVGLELSDLVASSLDPEDQRY